MDLPATQICDDNDFTPTQKICHSTLQGTVQDDVEVGLLSIGSNTYPIREGINTIGRHPACNIILNDQTVSKKHAEIEANSYETSAWVCDLNSSNRTTLNNSVLRPGRLYELKNGNVLEFGMVRAIYKAHRNADESMVPETPALRGQKKQEVVIPGTPDSSLNNSSTLGENSSIIPSTQASGKRSAFRYPSLPLRITTSSGGRRSSSGGGGGIQDSNASVDDSTDDTRYSVARSGKENAVGEDGGRVSIHDMETQQPFESNDEMDAHDVETQKICPSEAESAAGRAGSRGMNIHDMETQRDEDVHAVAGAARKVGIQAAAPRRDCTLDSENRVAPANGEEKSSTSDAVPDATGSVSSPGEAGKRADGTEDEADGNSQAEYLRLSFTTNFEDEPSGLDESRVLLSSPNLLQSFSSDEESESTEPRRNDARASGNEEDENLFDAATQVIERDESNVKGSSKASPAADDSDNTDNECVLQVYSRVDSQATQRTRSQVSDNDSDTDEEGRFAEVAMKEKRAASVSFERRRSDSSKGRNDTASSKDSDDLFEALTQAANPPAKGSPVSLIKEDIDAARGTGNEARTNDAAATTEAADDTAAPRIPSATSAATKAGPSRASERKASSDEEDVTEMVDDTPTQILSGAEKTSDATPDRVPSPSHSRAAEVCSVENVDYEMAPTQLIDEVDPRKSASHEVADSSGVPEKPGKVNLDDTLERNLNEMFNDAGEEGVAEQPRVSTQVLEDMLQSQADDKSSTENGEAGVEKVASRKPRRGRKSRSALVPSPTNSEPKDPRGSSSMNANADTDSQNSENYFSALTSRRKRNIIADSQTVPGPADEKSDSRVEEACRQAVAEEVVDSDDDKGNEICATPPRVAPKMSSTPRPLTKLPSSPKSSRKDGSGDPKVDAIPDERDIDSNVTNESSRNVTSETFTTLPDGTLSNPASPSSSISSEYRINVNRNRSRNAPAMIAPKTRRGPRRASRKSAAAKYTKDPATCRDPVDECRDSTAIASNDDSSLSGSRETSEPAGDGRVGKKSGRSTRRRTRGGTRESTESEPVPVPDKVDKEAPAEETVGKAGKRNAPSATTARVGKRSYSMTDTVESSKAKKRKQEAKEDAPAAGRAGGRRGRGKGIAAGRRSANILDYIAKSSSPVNGNDSGNIHSALDARDLARLPVLRLARLSQSTPTGSIASSTPTESVPGSVAADHSREKPNPRANSRSIENKRQRAANRDEEPKAEEIGSEIGEESQEVEMIMNGSLGGQNLKGNVVGKRGANESTQATRSRKNRKRAIASGDVDADHTGSSTCSDVGDSDSARFEVPPSKVKRANVSGNTVNANSVTINESVEATSRSRRFSSRPTRGRQQVTENSSVEENSQIATSQNGSSVTTTSKGNNNSRSKRQKKTASDEDNSKKPKGAKKSSSSSSDLNSSIDATSILSMSSRSRRSMSASFSSSSQSKSKHKILFTGISSNEYSKLLTKLGASQVEDPAKCTVLVTDKVRRTVKFLCTLALSVPIVSVDWLVDSQKAGCFVELDDYILRDDAAETKFGFKLSESLAKSRERKLLEGYTIVLTPNITAPPLPELKSIVTACGGKVLVRPPPAWPLKSVIISRQEDLANAKKFLAKAPKTVTLQSTEFILTGILRQELDFTEFKLN